MSPVGDFDIKQWAADNNLSEETLQGLLNEGFDSIKTLTLLTSEDVLQIFGKDQRLPLAQVCLLKEAVLQLQGEHESRFRSITEDTSSRHSSLSREHEATAGRRHDKYGPPFQDARMHFKSVKDQNENASLPEKATCVESEEDDLKDSESRTKLTTDTVQALRTNGFTSLELIRLLTPDHITNIMQKAHNLPYAQVVALVNAVKQLQDCSAGHVLDKREYIENTLKKQPIFNLKQQAQEITQTSLQVKVPDEDEISCLANTSSETEEMKQWAQREKLAPGTLSKLREQGFESLEDLTFLTSTDINDMCPDHLTKAQCLRLVKAMERLKGEKSAATTMSSDNFDHHKVQEMKQWANKVNLPLEILEILCKDGFTSLEDLSFLTPEEINHYSDKHLLTRSQCLRLEQAVKGLNMENSQATASFTENVESSKERLEDLRLLLVGKTGAGKSKTGNTILGEDKFETSVGFSSQTSKCEIHQGLVFGLKVEITNSPGFFDTSNRDYAFAEKVVQTVALMHPGVHAFLFIIKIGRFTKEEEGTYMRLKAIFDEHVTKYMVIVFTGGDNLTANGETIEDIISTAPKGLKDILKACGQRYIVFDNMTTDKKPQVRRLLNIVTKMVKENDNQSYTCPIYMSVKDKMEEEIQNRMMAVEEKEIQNTRYIKELEAKTKVLEDMAKKAQEDFNKREKEREKQVFDLQEKVEKRMQLLLEQSERSRISDNELEKRMKILEKEKEDLWNDFNKKQKEDRRKMEVEEQKRIKRSEALMEEMRKAREARDKAYEEEMRRFKESIAQN